MTTDRHPDDPIEHYLLDVAFKRRLPERSIAVCAERYGEAGPFLRAALEKCANGADDAGSPGISTVLFRGLHIMGGVRDTEAFGPLIRLLQRPYDDLDWLLGDAITETLPKIIVGTFDGNADTLFDAVVDEERDELVRDSLLRAATFLTWEGRIDRSHMVEFLERFGSDGRALQGEAVWNGWAEAIALLGLRDLEPLVIQVVAKGFIEESIFDRDLFDGDLARAEGEPANVSRFTDAVLGYLDDIVGALRSFPVRDDEWDEKGAAWPETEELFDSGPVVNPWRHVGRNDPCPCGSGKKAKRCCLAA